MAEGLEGHTAFSPELVRGFIAELIGAADFEIVDGIVLFEDFKLRDSGEPRDGLGVDQGDTQKQKNR